MDEYNGEADSYLCLFALSLLGTRQTIHTHPHTLVQSPVVEPNAKLAVSMHVSQRHLNYGVRARGELCVLVCMRETVCDCVNLCCVNTSAVSREVLSARQNAHTQIPNTRP